MKIKDVISLMKSAKSVCLSTINSEGFPETRALLNLANSKNYPKLEDKAVLEDEQTITVYFTTNTSSRKIEQIRKNNKVSLYYCEEKKFLGACLMGTVMEITDMEVKKSFWQTAWRIYYPKGYTDPEYTLCKFTSDSINCWGGFAIHNFGKMLKNSCKEDI